MKVYSVVAATLAMSVSMFAQAAKPCEELKSEIAKKLDDKQVKSYTLEIVEKDKDAQGTVVGSCDGGTKKIVYQRTASGSPKPPAAQANKQ